VKKFKKYEEKFWTWSLVSILGIYVFLEMNQKVVINSEKWRCKIVLEILDLENNLKFKRFLKLYWLLTVRYFYEFMSNVEIVMVIC